MKLTRDSDFVKPVRISVLGILLIIVFLWLPPQKAYGGMFMDTLIDMAGLLACITGGFVRFCAWGANRVTADLRVNGPYKLIRHPLYFGNFLVAFGLIMIINNLVLYVIAALFLVVFFFFLSRYEEQDMIRKMGAEYEEYLKEVRSRFFPQLSNLSAAIESSKDFDWKFGFLKSYKSFLIAFTIPFILDAAENLMWNGMKIARKSVTIELIFALCFIVVIFSILRNIREGEKENN